MTQVELDTLSRKMTALEKLAVMVAIEAPSSNSSWRGTSKSTYVRWDIVKQIREELRTMGYDWAAVKLRKKLIDRERRRVHGRGLVAIDS